ncbi:MAG: glycosyltransferase family 2 protein [Muribaculaceae bacterium]|nr:glycosyltransferase family 2 protein [Muribaculaceae bacterium]
MLDLTVIILTFNEEIHISRCLDRLKDVAREVIVVDSYSTDRTCEIAASKGARIVKQEWPGCQAEQFNRAIDNLAISTEWILRLDADEYLSPELIQELNTTLHSTPEDISAFVIPLGRVFMGRRLRHGIVNGVSIIRLFRTGKARYEKRLMDEHLSVNGKIGRLKNPFIDDSLLPLDKFVEKHNGYAIREAATLLTESDDNSKDGLSDEVAAKRKKKQRYARMPLLWRAFGYFLYRYIFKLGFLDGREGFLWDFMQGWWYRTLVDAKVLEIRRKAQGDPKRIREILAREYGVRI